MFACLLLLHQLSTGFILYAGTAVSLAVYLIYWVGPRIGQTNILVYISICSLLGSLSVVFAKGLSIAIRLTLTGSSQLFNPLAWFFLIAMASGITIQMNYLNKALDIFNTALVTPIYYVMFTTLTITSSAILFKEWTKLSSADVVGDVCGFMTTISGVFLLHMFKDIKVTMADLISHTGRKDLPAAEEKNAETSIKKHASLTTHSSTSLTPVVVSINESGDDQDDDVI